MSESRAVSVTDVAEEVAKGARLERFFLGRIDDADERTTIERTDAEREAFRAKLQEWRRTGGIPSYTGPRAAR